MGKLSYIGRTPAPAELAGLWEAVGRPPIDESHAGFAVRMDLFSVVVTLDNEAVACGRVLGDGVLYFSIHDLLVHPRVQRRGIGTKVMEVLLEWIGGRAGPAATVALSAAPGTAGFFERFGFAARPGDSPGMVLARAPRAGNA